jgi:hypothetical protein
MLIVDMSEDTLPGDAKQNNLPPECGQPIDAGESEVRDVALMSETPGHYIYLLYRLEITPGYWLNVLLPACLILATGFGLHEPRL